MCEYLKYIFVNQESLEWMEILFLKSTPYYVDPNMAIRVMLADFVQSWKEGQVLRFV